MPLDEFILRVFVLVDDLVHQLASAQLRRRGFAPALTDAEVVTVELVGEFLGLDHDKGIVAHFRRHYAAEFPALARVHRTTFARQAANLYAVKKALHAHPAAQPARPPRPRPDSRTPCGCGPRLQQSRTEAAN